VVGVAGVAGAVSARENEDIFLGEVWVGGKVGIEKREMDVHLDQFSCARLGAKCGLKEKPNFSKNLLKSAI
jgi:hypothetical protein